MSEQGAPMDWMEIMKARHSVRRFTEEPLREEAIAAIRAEIDAWKEKKENREAQEGYSRWLNSAARMENMEDWEEI